MFTKCPNNKTSTGQAEELFFKEVALAEGKHTCIRVISMPVNKTDSLF